MRDVAVGNIISNWNNAHPLLFGEHSIKLSHTLGKSKLFTDAALIDLLDNVPRGHYHVTTMEKGVRNPGYKREGDFGELGGAEILQAVKRGSLWINFQRPDELKPEYRELLRDIYAEFETRVGGLKTFKHKMTILISSPNLKVKYHFDLPGQTLWQLRGKKRVYVYPARAPFLTETELEKVTINEAHETDLVYREWFDEYAEIYELEPGQMLHWPINRPHRIENHDSLNVSLTTEHWTKQLRNRYAVNYGNAMLRKLGLKRLSSHAGAFNLLPKAAITAATRISGIQRKKMKPFEINFEVDPDCPDSVRDIAPYTLTEK